MKTRAELLEMAEKALLRADENMTETNTKNPQPSLVSADIALAEAWRELAKMARSAVSDA